jgi:hypothetical protein
MPLSSRATKGKEKQGSRGPKQAPLAHTSDNDEATSAKVAWVQWDNEWTEHLIDWLESNPEDHKQLFSDLSQNARQGHRAQHISKSSKSVFHSKITWYVFSTDPDEWVQADLDKDPPKYTKAVKNQISV